MKSPYRLLLAVVPALFIAACGGGDDDDLDDRLDLADPKVRLVHAVPLGPRISLFRNDEPQASEVTNMPYKGASNYFDVSVNEATWEARTTASPNLEIGAVTFDPTRGKKYTLVAVPDAGDLTELVLITDPYNKGVTSDNARLRVFNAAFNAANLDIYLTARAADIATTAPTFPAVAYKQAMPGNGEDSIEVEGGTYRLRMTNAGSKSVVFDAEVVLSENADWLLVPVPASLSANHANVLVVRSDSDSPAVEIDGTP
jgi:hypothetical protein